MPKRGKQFFYPSQTSWPVIGLASGEGVGGGGVTAPTAPVLAWVSANTDTTPEFTIDIDDTVAEGDTLTFQRQANGGDWSSPTETSSVITAGEDLANEISLALAELPAGDYEARCRVVVDGVPSAWSNVVDFDIAASYETESEAIFAAFTTPPDDTRKGLIDNLVVALKTDGVWAKLDVLDVFAAADSQAALINWKAPGTFNPSLVGAPTFTADRGFTTNGSSSYINTNFNPVTAGGQFTQNSAAFGIWSRTSAQASGGGGIDIGSRVNGAIAQNLITTRSSTNTAIGRVNVDTSPANTGASTDGAGHFALRRSASNAWALFRNATSIASGSDTSSAPTSQSFYVGAVNGAGTAGVFVSRQYAAAHIGSSLTDADMTALYNALNTYLVAVGAA